MTQRDAAASSFRPPVAPTVERRPTRRLVHGVELVDDYAWLRSARWQAVLREPKVLDTDILAMLEAENAYAAATMAPFADVVGMLGAEMRGRIKEDDAQVPKADGPWLYYMRHRQGGQHPLFCRRARDDTGDEQVMLDGDAEALGSTFFSIETVRQAPDHARLAWSVDEAGSELHTIRVRDLASGTDADDAVHDTDGNLVWLADSSGFYYVHVDDNHRTCQVFRHLLGTDPARDELIVEETNPAWFVHIGRTRSGAFAIVQISDHDATECHVIDLADRDAKARLVEPRQPGHRYDVEHNAGHFLIRTNVDGAEDFKVVVAPVATPAQALWRDVVPHRRGCTIVTFSVLREHLIRLEREDGLPRIVLRRLETGEEHAIAFAEDAYQLGLDLGFEFDTDVVRFGYSSMRTPREVFDYAIGTRERTLLKRQEIPSGHDPDRYVTRRIFAVADDGVRIPVSLLHRADLPTDGDAPVLLYGYGAYGSATPASFAPNRLSLVDRGFIYAIAHVRGGTDKGWSWYTDGKLARKMNTFTDFIAAGRHLVAEELTRPGRIVAHGGSAGGMLMGAIANLAPELFAGIIADVPFVDVLNTMLDGDLPLTPPEWLEWGDPIRDPAAFAYIKSYSPYDNVAARNYPPVLAFGGLTDPRVTYWEPAKWVARLRAQMTGGGPVMLQTNMGAGHGGASGRFDRLREVALTYAFALACVGRHDVTTPAR